MSTLIDIGEERVLFQKHCYYIEIYVALYCITMDNFLLCDLFFFNLDYLGIMLVIEERGVSIYWVLRSCRQTPQYCFLV